jgi:hypothetical protein
MLGRAKLMCARAPDHAPEPRPLFEGVASVLLIAVPP